MDRQSGNPEGGVLTFNVGPDKSGAIPKKDLPP